MTFKRAFLLTVFAELLIACFAMYRYGITLEGLQATTRFSGRFSLAIFSLIFIFLIFKRDTVSGLLSSKPFHIFAIAHGIHLIELLSFVYLSKANLIPLRLAGGFMAYVFIFIMPVVHYYFDNGQLSQSKYILAENMYLYYVWFIFFMSYLPRIQGKLPQVGGSYIEFVGLMIWVCLLLAIRLTLLIYQKRASPFKTS